MTFYSFYVAVYFGTDKVDKMLHELKMWDLLFLFLPLIETFKMNILNRKQVHKQVEWPPHQKPRWPQSSGSIKIILKCKTSESETMYDLTSAISGTW